MIIKSTLAPDPASGAMLLLGANERGVLMEKKTFTVGSFAKLTGITERALRYYDRKGLLTPSDYNQQGHRLYTHDNLVEVQKILTLKYLGYSLEEIGEHLENSGRNIMVSLNEQANLLQQKRDHIDQ